MQILENVLMNSNKVFVLRTFPSLLTTEIKCLILKSVSLTLRNAFTPWHHQGHAEPKKSTHFFFKQQTNDSCMLLLKHPTFITCLRIVIFFPHFSDKAEYPWLFPSCLFQTSFTPFMLALHFLLPDAGRPTLLSAQIAVTRSSALGGDGAGAATQLRLRESRQSSAGDLHLAWWHSDVLTPSREFAGGARLGFSRLITHWAVRLARLNRMWQHHSEYTSGERICCTCVMNKLIIVHIYTYIWMSCMFRDVILQILVVVALVPVVFLCSDHWPLTSKGIFFFPPTQRQVTSYFLFLGPFSGCDAVEIPVDQQQVVKLSDLQHQQPCSPLSKSPKSPSSLLFWCCFELQQVVYVPEFMELLPLQWLQLTNNWKFCWIKGHCANHLPTVSCNSAINHRL